MHYRCCYAGLIQPADQLILKFRMEALREVKGGCVGALAFLSPPRLHKNGSEAGLNFRRVRGELNGFFRFGNGLRPLSCACKSGGFGRKAVRRDERHAEGAVIHEYNVAGLRVGNEFAKPGIWVELVGSPLAAVEFR